MPVSLNCPAGHRLTVSRRYAGKLVRCPKCGQKVRIPPMEVLQRKLREKQQRQSGGPPALPPRREGRAPGPSSETQQDTAVREKRRAAEKTPPRRPPPTVPSRREDLKRKPPVRPAPAIEAPESAPPSTAVFVIEPVEAPPAVGEVPVVEEAPVRGYEPEPDRRWTSYSLGAAMALLALFAAAPAVLEIADYIQSDQTIPIARWAWLALLASAIQLAYAVYAAQLPDWSTAWVVTFVGAALATLYAALLGLTLLAGEESRIVALLELGDPLRQGSAAKWCFVMLGVFGLYAYFGGRFAMRWRHAFEMTRPVKEQRRRA